MNRYLKFEKSLFGKIIIVLVLIIIAFIWFKVLASIGGTNSDNCENTKTTVDKQWQMLLKALQTGEVK